MKLRFLLSYMSVNPEAGIKKKHYFHGQQLYDKNRSYGRSLMDAGFIPFSGADEDIFIDIVDRNHELFPPDIINSIEDDTKSEEE